MSKPKRGGGKGKAPRRPSRYLRGVMRRAGGGYGWSHVPERLCC